MKNATIDLHGVKHAEVTGLLDEFLYRHMVGHTAQVSIVTGNSEAMKAEVRKVLTEYGLTGTEGFWNRGELKVDLFSFY